MTINETRWVLDDQRNQNSVKTKTAQGDDWAVWQATSSCFDRVMVSLRVMRGLDCRPSSKGRHDMAKDLLTNGHR